MPDRRLDCRVSCYPATKMVRVEVTDSQENGHGYFFELEAQMARWLADEMRRQADILDPPSAADLGFGVCEDAALPPKG